jgi:hypothetical protein
MREFENDVDILHVYISEAHAQDEWPIGGYAALQQPKNVAERLEIAQAFAKKFKWQVPMVVAPPEDLAQPASDSDAKRIRQTCTTDAFDAVYACWPFRIYIIDEGAIAYKAQVHQCSFEVFDARNFLLTRLGRAWTPMQVDVTEGCWQSSYGDDK